MRPVANFTLHAILAAALAALATTSAAAQYAASRFLLELDGGNEGMVGSAEGSRGGQIEIESWQFGEAAKVDSFTVKQKVKPAIPVAEVKSPRDAGSGLATGKRQHKPALSRVEGPVLSNAEGPVLSRVEGPVLSRVEGPVLSRVEGPTTITRPVDRPDPTLPDPPSPGSLLVKVKYPWPACRVGARYPRITLSGGAKSHVLEDVTVSSCGGAGAAPEESITFVYGKMVVK